MDSIKPSILMGKLKQLLPHRVSSDINLFLSIFLIRLPPSMREMVGASNHKTAAAMVEALDALWNTCGDNTPTIAVGMAWHSRSPTPAKGKKGYKRGGRAQSKSRPSSPSASHKFKTPSMARVSVTISLSQGPECVWTLAPIQKTNRLPSTF
jgi:hypothetical protein